MDECSGLPKEKQGEVLFSYMYIYCASCVMTQSLDPQCLHVSYLFTNFNLSSTSESDLHSCEAT